MQITSHYSPLAHYDETSSDRLKRQNGSVKDPTTVKKSKLKLTSILLIDDSLLKRAQEITNFFLNIQFEEAEKKLSNLLILKKERTIHENFISVIPFIRDETVIDEIKTTIVRYKLYDILLKIINYYVIYETDCFKYVKKDTDLNRNLHIWLFLYPSQSTYSQQLYNDLLSATFFKHLLCNNQLFHLTLNELHFEELLSRVFSHPRGCEYVADLFLSYMKQPEKFSLGFFQALHAVIEKQPNKKKLLLIFFPKILVLDPALKLLAHQCHTFHLIDLLCDSAHLEDKCIPLKAECSSVKLFTNLFLDPPNESIISSPRLRLKLKWMVFLYVNEDDFWEMISRLPVDNIKSLTQSILKLNGQYSEPLLSSLINSLLLSVNYNWGQKNFEAVLKVLCEQNQIQSLSLRITQSLLQLRNGLQIRKETPIEFHLAAVF